MTVIFKRDIYDYYIIFEIHHKIMYKNLMRAILFLIIPISISFSSAHATHLINPQTIHAIMTDPVAVFGKTYQLKTGNSTYNIYYGFYKATSALASDVSTIPEQNSLKLQLSGVTELDPMWIKIPQQVIRADNNNFVVYVDGKETRYELAVTRDSTILGFMIPLDATLVEIKGTKVIPEFPIPIIMMTVGLTIFLFTTRVLKKSF